MLRTLSIRDVVLIDRLDVAFDAGLCVLTGETGAGKSILLDSLGLALGGRAEARLVRSGADLASVTAEFELPRDHPVLAVAAESGIAVEEGTLLLRRTVNGDGRSRAFVNDQAVSVALLRRVGESLVEIHGQFESQRLLNPATHRDLLDSHGGLGGEVAAVATAWRRWRESLAARDAARETLEAARRDEEFLRHAVDELTTLDPRPDEDEVLAARRAAMMHGEKLLEALNQAAAELGAGRGVETALRAAARHLERMAERAQGRLDGVIAALDRAAEEVADGVSELERVSGEVDLDPAHLERVEERLFTLRAVARKHGVEVADLARLRDDMAARLAAVEDGGSTLERLRREEKAARGAYIAAADSLGKARRAAALALDRAVAVELAPLKMEKARFVTSIETLDEAEWSGHGRDRVTFLVATNPGTAPGPLGRIASGGELARFMLALKVVLARSDPVPTMVFDEVDAGIGGAVAAAVGERLARLGDGFQVLVVTHSPQVAARGVGHLRVAKEERGGRMATLVTVLSPEARREEIARMLSGAEITDAARAAAEQLLGKGSLGDAERPPDPQG